MEIGKALELESNLVKNFGLSETEVVQIAEGYDLKEANKKLSSKVSSLLIEKEMLSHDYTLYRTILISMGQKVDPIPPKLDDLRKAVVNMKSKCFEDLGDNGFLILSFLRSDSKLDDKVTMIDIINFLVRFRPVFQQFLNKEAGNA